MDFAQIWVGVKLTGPRGAGAGAPPREIVTGPCGGPGPRGTPKLELRGQRIGSARAVALSVCLLMANLIGKSWLVVGSFYSFVFEKFGGREKEGGPTGRTADDV